MSVGTYIRTEETREKLSKSLRDFHRKKRISEGLKDFHRKKKVDEEKKQQAPPEEKNKFDSSASQINSLSKDELSDTLIETQQEIDKKIGILARDFRALSLLQEKQEKMKIRLTELGGTIGKLRSSAREWKEE